MYFSSDKQKRVLQISLCFCGCSSSHKDLDPSITTWRTDEPLTLIPGGFYFIRIAVVNGAGLTAVHDTDGVIVDPSPPVVSQT